VLRTGYLLWVLTCIPDSAMSQAARSRPRRAGTPRVCRYL